MVVRRGRAARRGRSPRTCTRAACGAATSCSRSSATRPTGSSRWSRAFARATSCCRATSSCARRTCGCACGVCPPALVVCHERNAAVLAEAGWSGPTILGARSPLRSCRAAALPPPADLAPLDPCLITFTSGTAGEPKAVVHGQRYLAGQALQAEHWLAPRPATSSGAPRRAAGASRRATSSSRRGSAARRRSCTTRASTRRSASSCSSASASTSSAWRRRSTA